MQYEEETYLQDLNSPNELCHINDKMADYIAAMYSSHINLSFFFVKVNTGKASHEWYMIYLTKHCNKTCMESEMHNKCIVRCDIAR